MNNLENNSGEIVIPKTITPGSVWGWNFFLFAMLWTVLFLFFGPFWSTIITGIALGSAIWGGGIATEGKDFHGFLLFDPITKKRRVVFPGLHPKCFWEKVEEGSERSLRRVVESEGEQNFATNDPAENMLVNLAIHKRVNVSGTPEQASDNFIRFHSIPPESLTKIVRRDIVRECSRYYSNKEMEALTNAGIIEDAILALPATKTVIEDLETRWGVSVGIVLDSSRADDATKAMKRTPAMAEALATAMEKLDRQVTDPDMRRRIVMILDPNNDYKEERIDLNIQAPDLKNLQHVSIIPPGTMGKGGKQK